jgi:hypothetical protein
LLLNGYARAYIETTLDLPCRSLSNGTLCGLRSPVRREKTMSKLHPLKAVTITLALVTGPAALADLYVVPTSEYPTIQSAIEACNQNGDEVVVAPGVYFEQIDFLGKSVWLHSSGGATATYIDGQGTSGPLVTFHTAEDENAILEGFTVRNAPNGSGISCNGSAATVLSSKIVGNVSDDGGGIRLIESDLTIDECEIKNNTSNTGGGLWISGGSLTMSNTLIRGNLVGDSGGGLYASEAELGIDSCTFQDNSAESSSDAKGGAMCLLSNSSLSMVSTLLDSNWSDMTFQGVVNSTSYFARGGGIFADNATAVITNCQFTANRAQVFLVDTVGQGDSNMHGHGYADGGDLSLQNFANFQVTRCNFGDGSAYAYGSGSSEPYADFVEPVARGGSIYLVGAYAHLTECNWAGCESVHSAAGQNFGAPRGDGGAIYSDTNGNPFMQDCSVIGCSASRHGGAIYTRDTASPFMLNGHLSANVAAENGGAIYSENSFPVITGAVINGNTALAGGGIFAEGAAPAIPTVSETLFCSNTEGHIAGDWYDDGGNLLSDDCGDDCNENGFPDEYDIIFGYSEDCDDNGTPDECDTDCDANGVPDTCDIADGTHTDCDANGVPDVCDEDCNANGVPDSCDLADGTSADCNGNAVPDECDIEAGTSVDCDENGVPDECEPDCNTNGVVDACDIADGTSEDCDANGVPDECDPISDCNDNGANDACDIANGDSQDDDGNGIPDECECPADVNGDGFINVNDLLIVVSAWGSTTNPAADIDGDGTVDVHDILILIDLWGDPCP